MYVFAKLLEYLQYPPSTAAGIKFARLASEPKDDVSVHNEKSSKSTVKEDDKKERIPSIVEATDRGADGLGSRYRYVADTYLRMLLQSSVVNMNGCPNIQACRHG